MFYEFLVMSRHQVKQREMVKGLRGRGAEPGVRLAWEVLNGCLMDANHVIRRRVFLAAYTMVIQ